MTDAQADGPLLVTDHPEADRYELRRGEHVIAIASYRRDGGVVTVHHVETRPEHREQGYAATLMDGVVDDLRSRSEQIAPMCSYARSYMQDNPAQHDLLAS